MIEEREDQVRFDVREAHGRGRLAESSLSEAEEQRQAITIASHSARTHGTLGHQVLGEERLHQRAEGGGLRGARFTHGALPQGPSWTRSSWRQAPSVQA